MAAGLAGLPVAGPSTPYGALVVQLTVLCVGLGLIVPAMTSELLGSVDRSRSGIALGTLNTARQTGSVAGVAVLGSFAATGVVAGLHRSLAVSIGLAVVALLLTVPLTATDV
jgi:DHA2 family methylenomycin A resistance protein-like MFS transporter